MWSVRGEKVNDWRQQNFKCNCIKHRGLKKIKLNSINNYKSPVSAGNRKSIVSNVFLNDQMF